MDKTNMFSLLVVGVRLNGGGGGRMYTDDFPQFMV